MIAAIGGFAQGQEKSTETQTVTVNVTAKGFEPASINLKANIPARITFLRETKDTCATSVEFPDYKIKKELPLNEAVTVEITPAKAGSLTFVCGMKMFRGKIVVL